MKTHNLTQGTPEWQAYRTTHFNASDAPAMMSESSYKTRTQLLHEISTGLVPEVDAATQRRFDDGHRFEALARSLAEEFIGLDLYPVVGSAGKLSASFDGLTMMEDLAFEHKTLNAALRECMHDGCTGLDLPMQYQIQMEHQLIVSGAGTCLFMASEWTADDELVEERHCTYVANYDLRAEIKASWAQFEQDLSTYVPAEVAAPVVGRTPETLPALLIELTGMVTNSNLTAYRDHALAVFGGINRILKTDQHFADAEKNIKWCGEVEARVVAAKQHALAQTQSIDQLFSALDDIAGEARTLRLELEKLVKAEKEAMRLEILLAATGALSKHIAALNERLGNQYLTNVTADFAAAMKGKRTIDSLRDAASTTLARAKIESSAKADGIQANLTTLKELGVDHGFLFADIFQIVHKAADDFLLLVKSRIANHAAAEAARRQAEREKIRAEEVAKLEAEEAAKSAKAVIDEATAKVEQEKEAAFKACEIDLFEQSEVVPASAGYESNLYPIFPLLAIAGTAPSTPSTPSLRLGQISERLGFNITASFLSELGFEPAATEKASKLFHEHDFAAICRALVAHIQQVSAGVTA